MKIKSILKYFVLLPASLYVVIFIFISFDLNNTRPVVSLFKLLQTDTSLKVIDSSLEQNEEKLDRTITSNPNKNVYFGDLHVHTKYSFDAYVFGVTGTPDDAYRYAKGASVKHPLGYDLQLREPLDFYAVTDHGFFMGMIESYADTTSQISKKDFAKPFHNLNADVASNTADENLDTFPARTAMFSDVVASTINMPYFDLHPKVMAAYFTTNVQLALKSFDYKVHKSAWADMARAAEEHNDPGNFTTFLAYEYTTSTDTEGGNLHRNVIFEGSKRPLRPFTRIDSLNPEDLWTWMDELRERGVDSIAIPHNGNGSNGNMFEMETFEGGPINRNYSSKRMRNEPLVEVTPVKGTSETHPLLSPDDEWADFEIMDIRVGSRPPTYSMPQAGYVRDAYLRGLTLDWFGQGNPYKFGLIGSTDTHVLGGSFDESNYWSKVGILDGTPESRGTIPLTQERIDTVRQGLIDANQPVLLIDREQGTYMDVGFDQWGASGLAAVWAEENTRESIFKAFRNKETFATSGSRIKLRFFAGYDISSVELDSSDLISQAYEKGVPMGSDINYDNDREPHFLVWAVKGKHGAPLQRIQIIKGWIDTNSGRPVEMVYDVVCSDGLVVDPITHRCPDNNAKVDINTCKISDDVGAVELKAKWQDPEFRSTDNAFYYVRVLENPTCRWSTWDAIKAGYKPRKDLHSTIQERAWSSPIWYVPEDDGFDIIPLGGTISLRD